jgi:ABC-2 type transport system ATP-binding protein
VQTVLTDIGLLDLVRSQLNRGICVLYTTHYMEEAEELCARLAITGHGHIIAAGTLDELRNMVGGRDVLRFIGHFELDRVRNALHKGLAGMELLQTDDDSLQIALSDAPRQLSAVISILGDAGAEIRETLLSRASLESLFIKLTGKELRD